MEERELMRNHWIRCDALNRSVIEDVQISGYANAREISRRIDKPYSTVLIRCLKLEANGVLNSVWNGNVKKYFLNPKRSSSEEEQCR
jgi:predicted transcriptional regulator